MPLSNEDNLRLNVLMAQKVKAIRIDEGKMILYALTEKGDAKVILNPNQKNEPYLKQVRDFLSTKVLGIAGGFPVYISHWNRLGEAKSNNLGNLLLLGEDEATIAVVNSNQLTAELAQYAWWAFQSADNARSMLSRQEVVEADIGKELAQFLLEFLPFEEQPEKMMASIRLVLQPGLISDKEKLSLWKKAKSKNTLYLGFMDTLPNNMPEKQPEHQLFQSIIDHEQANPYMEKLIHSLSSPGQTYIDTAIAAFKRIPNQVVYSALIESIRRYFAYPETDTAKTLYDYSLGLRTNGEVETDISKIAQNCMRLLDDAENPKSQMINQVARDYPDFRDKIHSIFILANISQAVTFPVFSQSNAEGTLMRKKLKPVTDTVLSYLMILKN